MSETGRRKVETLVMDGLAELDKAGSRQPPVRDPVPGEDRNGVPPGQWTPGPDGLPPDCPVQTLGKNGDVIYLVDSDGQLHGVTPTKFTKQFIKMIFGQRQNYLYWAWPRWNQSKKAVDNWEADAVQAAFYAAASYKGIWNAAETVRGRGAWLGADGELILHCGGGLIIDGERVPIGERDGYFYPRRPSTFLPSPDPISDADNPAHELLALIRTWAWERRQVDPVLLLGWICGALLGGALPWRPSAFLVGDRGTGKSSLQDVIKSALGGALVSSTDTTAAGIYQRIGNDSLPVGVDELEAEEDNRRAMAVVKLARLAASGGLMLRGGQDHTGVEFQARSTFLFSAINPPPLQPQDKTRIVSLNLKPLELTEAGRAPALDKPDSVAPRLMRRLLDAWPDFERLFHQYREVLMEGGHDSRGQDTFGTLLTCAHLALGDAGMEAEGLPMESLQPWAELLAAENVVDQEADNWRSCFRHLLTSRVEAWRHGTQHTVGQILDDMQGGRGVEPEDCRSQLGQAGLGLLFHNNPIHKGSYILAVPNSGPLLAQLFKGSKWAGSGDVGGWSTALKQGPPHIFRTDKTANRCRINGVQQRCVMVVMDGWEEANG